MIWVNASPSMTSRPSTTVTVAAWFLAAAEEHGVLRAQPQPARFGQRHGRGLAVVVHERVELLDAGEQRGHP